jgi:3-isopropylmalate/(R)-2-methylmalate dehydratase small subunit
MHPFKTLTAIAAPLPLMNVDTDMIIPKQFLRTIKRTGLGRNLFNDLRYAEDGTPLPDFVLNKSPYTNAQILVTGENFGCGSSREHAPWALMDFGIRCVIAPSYADIFYNNCFKNGILPVTLKQSDVDLIMDDARAGLEVTVDLEQQVVRSGNRNFSFDIDPFRKKCLMGGLDDIGLTLEKAAEIDSFENTMAARRPWI